MDVRINICTFGSEQWAERGSKCLQETSLQFPNHNVVHHHGGNFKLHEMRNKALEETPEEFVIFLDADDRLDNNYIKEMEQGKADIRVPAVRYIRNKVATVAHVPSVVACQDVHTGPCSAPCLTGGNYIVVGAVARTEALRWVGGFRDWPMYEDWDLWLRCYQNGATFETLDRAVYIAHHHANSRNRLPNQRQRLLAHKMIAQANGIDFK